MREQIRKSSPTTKSSTAKVAVPQNQAIASGNVLSRNASTFEHDFSRIPAHSRSDAPLQEQSSHTDRDGAAILQTVFGEDADDSFAIHTSADDPPRQSLNLVEKLKMFRYHRKQKQMASRQMLSGIELKKSMDREYQYKAWYYVLSGGSMNTGGLSWTPISDIAAVEEAKPSLGSESFTPRAIPWLETDQPLVLNVPDGTGTVTATLLDNQDTADILAITQNEDELSSGPVKDKGDKVIARFDASSGGSILLHVKLARGNIANADNPTADPEGPIWALPKFTVLIAPDSIAKELFNPPRVFGPYKEPIRSVLRKLRKAGAKPLE
jgi:hypothetical protein